jgi:hypothetical protein
MVFDLMLPRDRLVEINARTAFNLIPCELDPDVEWAPCTVSQRDWGDKNLPTDQDNACFDHNVSNCPRLIVKIEIVNTPNVRVDSGDRVIPQVFGPAQTHVLPPRTRKYISAISGAWLCFHRTAYLSERRTLTMQQILR